MNQFTPVVIKTGMKEIIINDIKFHVYCFTDLNKYPLKGDKHHILSCLTNPKTPKYIREILKLDTKTISQLNIQVNKILEKQFNKSQTSKS